MDNILNLEKIKLTTARKAILELLSNSKKPLSYEDVKEFLLMDKATFYRNIAIFEEEDIIDSFESNDKKRYFELKRAKHSHFICSDCYTIECIEENPKFSLKNYKIDNIILKGVCKDCNKDE